MARAHVLTRRGATTRIAWHIVVPDSGTNGAGIPWRTALLNSGLIVATVLGPGDGQGGTISSAEDAELGAGALVEMVTELSIPTGLTTAQVNAYLDTHHAALAAEVQSTLTDRLRYFGFTRV